MKTKTKILWIWILAIFWLSFTFAQSQDDISKYWWTVAKLWQQMIDNANAAIQKDDWTNDYWLNETDFWDVKKKGVNMWNKLKSFWVNMQNWNFDQKSFYKIINDVRDTQKFIIGKFYENYMNSKWATRTYIVLNLIDMNIYWENANRRENMTSDKLWSIFDDYTNNVYKDLRDNTNKQKSKYPDYESLYEKSYKIWKKYIDQIVDLQKQTRNWVDVRPQMDSLIKNMVKDWEQHKIIWWPTAWTFYTSYEYIITKLLYYRNQY